MPVQNVAPVAAVRSSRCRRNKYITISQLLGLLRNHLQTNYVCGSWNYYGKGDVLCVIEAMKLFNEIESEVSGKIKILVDDMSPVEFDQPLFLVDP
jgi:acetyl-CoA carboxylase biotin carboxyl carrier protein